jgi:nitrous oxidase accessory protein
MYATDNTFSNSVLRDNVAGAAIMYSTGVKLFNNEFAYNKSKASGYGLLFKDVDNLEMTDNRIHHNRVGLTMDGAPRTPGAFVTLRGNLIGYNEIALDMFTTTDVTFVENTFVGNVRQVESRGGNLEKRNTWSLDGRGNYWDDYHGFDSDGDGIGDIEYRYEGAFDDLVERSAAIQAYSFTFARSAIDLSARWFPVYRPAPPAVDPHPLMRPTVTLRESGTSETRWQWIAMGALLTAVPAGLFIVARRSFVGRWQACSS